MSLITDDWQNNDLLIYSMIESVASPLVFLFMDKSVHIYLKHFFTWKASFSIVQVFSDVTTLLLFYKCLARSMLEYGYVIWSLYIKNRIATIESVQSKFLTLASCYTVSPMSAYCHNYDPIIAHLGLIAAPTAFYLSRSLVYIHCNQSADCFSRYPAHAWLSCLRTLP